MAPAAVDCELAAVVPENPMAKTCASPPIDIGSVMLATVFPGVSRALTENANVLTGSCWLPEALR